MAPEPGRLVGWGQFYTGAEVAPTLPQGAAAEGFIQVDTDEYSGWIALREDGTAIAGKATGSVEALPDFGSRIIQVSRSTHWVVLLEDGTVRCGGDYQNQPESGYLQVPPEVRDIVSIGAGGSCSVALSASGQLFFWGRRDKFDEAFHERLAPLSTEVKSISTSRGSLVLQRAKGEVHRVYTANKPPRFQRMPDFQGATQVAAGVGGVAGVSPEGRFLLNPPSPPKTAPVTGIVRVAAGELHRLAQREDGTWINLGANYLEEADPERLNGLLAFSLNGRRETQSGFGIAPSALARPVVQKPVPEAEVLLNRLETAEEAAAAELEQWKARYFQALDGLLQKQPSPALQSAIAEEREQAELLSRPATEIPALQKYQAVFRERLPDLFQAKRTAELAALDEATGALRELQDQLTREKRLEDAVTVRELHESLLRKRSVLAELPEASSATAGGNRFPAIPSANRIFQIGEPIPPGELVVIGTEQGSPPAVPRALLRKPIRFVQAQRGAWLVINEDGDFHCHGEYGRLHFGKKAQAIRGLAWGLVAGRTHGFMGQDRRGDFVAWGWDTKFGNPVLPTFLEEGPFREIKVFALSGTGLDIQKLLALRPDGTVLAGGKLYEAGAAPWVLPPNLGKCRSLIVTDYLDGALREDGTLVTWGTQKKKVPPTFTNLALLRQQDDLVLGLRQDGTVVAWNLGGAHAKLLAVPPGLTQVVDLEVNRNLALALRADGTWVGWGGNADGLLDQLDQLKGCRQVTIGGNSSQERFVLGIRPSNG